MKIFISWSGEKSRQVALALREWLPLVINSAEPFVSSKDIYAGTRWQSEISGQLEASNFGIVVVTRENRRAPWLHFEAGALAKAVEVSRVVPLAVDLAPSDVELPLGQFQAQSADEAGVGEICRSINDSLERPLDAAMLARALAKWWPDLELELGRIKNESPSEDFAARRSERELLEEVLNTVRSLARDRTPRAKSVPAGRAPVVEAIIELLRARNSGPHGILHEPGANRVTVSGKPVDPETVLELKNLVSSFGYSLQFGVMTSQESQPDFSFLSVDGPELEVQEAY